MLGKLYCRELPPKQESVGAVLVLRDSREHWALPDISQNYKGFRAGNYDQSIESRKNGRGTPDLRREKMAKNQSKSTRSELRYEKPELVRLLDAEDMAFGLCQFGNGDSQHCRTGLAPGGKCTDGAIDT